MAFTPIPEALEAIREGRMIVLVDDPDRENEGDLVIAAEKATPEGVNFMTRYGRGLLCLTLPGEHGERLHLDPLPYSHDDRLARTDRHRTAFTVTVDAAEGIGTGISAADRARTIRAAARADARPEDLARPGHIQPIVAKHGGVLRRPGHTEGSVDLARLAGLFPAGVICEIMNDDGTMARLPDLERFVVEHDLPICTIADLVRYRHDRERLVRHVASARLPTRHGVFDCHLYAAEPDDDQHLVLACGDIKPLGGLPGPRLDRPVLVRVHSGCLTGDLFGSLRCDCGEQLDGALRRIQEEGEGLLVYLHRHEGRGIGLENKIRAYALQEEGLDTVEANERLGFRPDLRDYGTGAQILADMGVTKIRLLSNNPGKFTALEGYGLEIVERVPLVVPPNEENLRYLETKRTKLGHIF